MKHLIPIPHFDNIPPYENREILCQMLDDIFGAVYQDIVGLNLINDPLRCKSEVLDALIEMGGGDINETDHETTKRVKAYNAQNFEFKRSLWQTIKNLIDGITTGNASFYIPKGKDDWALQSDNTTLTLDDEPIISQLITDYTGTRFGMVLLDKELDSSYSNTMNAYEPVRINTGIAVPEAEITALVKTIAPQIPAYKRVIIGYFDGATFTEYATIF